MAEKTVCFKIEEETIDKFKKLCIDNKKTMKESLTEMILRIRRSYYWLKFIIFIKNSRLKFLNLID